MHRAAVKQNVASGLWETRKIAKYQPVLNNHTRFLPVAIEATGRLGVQVDKFLRDMNKLHRNFRFHFRSNCSFIIHRAIAKCLHRTRGLMKGEIPLLSQTDLRAVESAEELNFRVVDQHDEDSAIEIN